MNFQSQQALQELLGKEVSNAHVLQREIGYEWLERFHSLQSKNPFYSIEEDICLCKLIVSAFPVGRAFNKKALSVQWFQRKCQRFSASSNEIQ
jgi:hypothetical protein